MSRASIAGSPRALPSLSAGGCVAGAWAVCCVEAAASSLGAFRRLPRLEVCETPKGIWLRGEASSASLEHRLRTLPGAQRYRVLADGQLVAAGRCVPRGYLPEGPWLALDKWITAALPAAALAGRLGGQVPLKIVRSAREATANVLLASFARWADYAVEAAEIRLKGLRFALAEDGRALICGNPLPPISGNLAVSYEGIVLPVGYFWSPAIDAAMVRQLLGLPAGDLALGRLDGTWESVAAACFVAATRSSVRASAKNLARRS